VPIREISRRLGVSRNTIRKYLRSDVTEPKFQLPDRPSKLDPYAEKLSAWLRREAGRPRKQRRTVKQLYGDLVSLGYNVSHNQVAAFAGAWKEESLCQAPGEGSLHLAIAERRCSTHIGCAVGLYARLRMLMPLLVKLTDSEIKAMIVWFRRFLTASITAGVSWKR